MADKPALTPALRHVLQVLAQAAEPHTYATLAEKLNHRERYLHVIINRDLRVALEGTGVSVEVRKIGREHRSRLFVLGPAETITKLITEAPAQGQPFERIGQPITLPSIGGVPYVYTFDRRLVVGGVVQPARAA